MRIVVPIKQVPETNAVKMDEQTGTMIREGVEAIVNPLDLYGIELAIQLKERYGGTTVAVSMGPPGAVKAIREALSMGIDEGVLVSGKGFAGSDTWATSYALSAAIRKCGAFDLVICGERATDGDTGQVGCGVASFLGLPVITYVGRFDGIDGGVCRVHRLVEDGYEVLEMDLPGVITVVKEVSDPRLPTLRGKQRAKRTDITVWDVSNLEVDASKLGLEGSPTRVVKIFKPQVARQAELCEPADEAGIDEAADRLVKFLDERQLL